MRFRFRTDEASIREASERRNKLQAQAMGEG